MKNLLLLLAALLCSCGSDSSAAPGKKNNVIHMDSVILRHPLVTQEDQHRIHDAVIARLELEYGINIIEDRRTEMEGLVPFLKIEEYELTLGYYANAVWIRNLCTKGKNRLCMISAGVLYDKDGIDYGGGFASGVCSVKKKGSVSWYTARSFNTSGEARQISSTNAGTHEGSHQIGAEHQDFRGCVIGSVGCTSEGREYPNIMHSAAGKFGNLELPVGPVAHADVNDCLKRAGLRRAKNRRSAERPVGEPLVH